MVCFFGDVHLGDGNGTEQRKRCELLLELLTALPRRCSHVVILGDLFDYWFDYRTVIPREFWHVIAALDQLQRQGVHIDYLMGNHDFGHWRFFAEELGIAPHQGDIERRWYGKRFYIAHGDGKNPRDWGYLLLRALLHNRYAQALYRLLHPDLGIGLARWASQRSRMHSTDSQELLANALEEFAQCKLREGFDVVVLGHSHLPVLKSFGTGWYLNPGGWVEDTPRLGCFDGERLQLLPVREWIAAIG